MKNIEIQQVTTRTQVKEFAKLPFKIYNNDKSWVPPILKQEIESIQPEHNPAFKICDACFWIALKNGECVGRIGAIINHAYNEKVKEKIGRFSKVEFIDDLEVSTALFNVAENWLKEKGMTKILGPLGFTNLDTQGLLIEGFEHIAAVGSVYHKEYYKKHIEALGYQKEIDWLEFRLFISDIPEKALRLNEVIKQRFSLEVVSFHSQKEMKKYVGSIFNLLNKAFDELPFVSPFTPDLVDYYVKKYFSLFNPRFVKLIKKDGEVVAFIIGFPDISEALQKARKQIFPFNLFTVLKSIKKPKGLELLLTAIDPNLQGQGLSAVLITELQKEILKHNIQYVETTGIFETNHKAIEHWKNYQHIQHKRRRCYVKLLK